MNGWLLSLLRALRTAPVAPSTGLLELRREPFPQRVDELCNKRPMALEFLGQRRVRARRARLTDRHRAGGLLDGDAAGVGDEAEPDLAPAGQLDIDLGEELCVEERAVLHAMAAVDSETHAQGVEAVLGAGMLAARELKGIAHPAHRDRLPAAA